jgi:coniferyl-aldehyde dehydrogenase
MSTDLDTAFAHLRRAQAREPLPDWGVRARRLRALESMLREQREAFAVAIDADFGRRPAE